MPRPVANPPNPWASTHVEYLGEAPSAPLEIFEEEARSVLTKNDSPDLDFSYSVNPYRGCLHACAYCYARPTHQYLGFGAGTDFDRKIVVKINTPEVLARELARPSWSRETVLLSGNTDCYQGLEANYRITRRCVEVLGEHETPFTIITKNALVARDVDVIAAAAARSRGRVFLSIPFADDADARLVEPHASRPSRRFEALAKLSEAGVLTGVSVAPVIPGLNDHAILEILERARAAGATKCFLTLVRLGREVRPVFLERIRAAMPGRAGKIERAIVDARGASNELAFGQRMRGEGARWGAIETMFRVHAQRLGFDAPRGMGEGPVDRFSEGLADEFEPLGPRTSPAAPSRSASPPRSDKRQLKLFD